MQTSDSIGAISKALVEFQKQVPVINKKRTAKVPTKSGGEYSYKYADLSDILGVVQEQLTANSLAISQSATNTAEGVGVITLLMHTSGEWVKSDQLILPLQGATAQAAGSAVTYARRYALSAILGISTEEDDDGKLATDHGRTAPQGARGQPPARQSAPSGVAVMPFGKSKGVPLTEAPAEHLSWMLDTLTDEKLKDERWGEANKRLKAALEAELAGRGWDEMDKLGEEVPNFDADSLPS